MAVNTGNSHRRLIALALGTALLSLPGAAFAQQDEHHGNGRGEGAPHPQQGARPANGQAQAQAPAPRAAPAPAAQPARNGNWREPGAWAGQPRPAPGNQPNYAPREPQSANRGQPSHGQPAQGQPAYQGQPRGNGADRNDGRAGRFDGGPGRTDGGPGRNDDGRGRNDDGQWRGHDGGEGRGNNGQWRGRDDGDRRGNDSQWRGGGPQGGGGPGYGRQQGGQWNHGWRQDNRYNWRGYREANRDSFHVGRYYAPYRNYNYNRLGVGFYLQPLFFGSDYWISDPWEYRLPPAYGPYHWVRYYNDVILVNTYNGQVADVIYDFFW